MSLSELGLLPSDLTSVFCFCYVAHSPQQRSLTRTHTHLLTASNTVGSVSSLVCLPNHNFFLHYTSFLRPPSILARLGALLSIF